MKLSEMNVHQRRLFMEMCHYMSEMIGGCENTMQDYPIGSEEYESAKSYLRMGHENLKMDIYNDVIHTCPKEARFAGKEFLMERIERRLNKWGY